LTWCNAHNVWLGTHEAGAPPPSVFPHTMLSVKRVKDNMWLACIKKFFTNYEIETNVQTRYLHFKGISYENESYLCDINCVQLWKVLIRFWCDNMQLEVMLGAWKGVPYAERLCRGYDLRKVEDEEHLLLVCPNTQKVIRGCFVFGHAPHPHEHSCWAHADYEHGRCNQVCGMLLVLKDNLSSMIYLSFNGLASPKWT
jgi:hypothetical protein